MPRKALIQESIDPEMAEVQRLMNLCGIQQATLAEVLGCRRSHIFACFNTEPQRYADMKRRVRERVLLMASERIRAAARLHTQMLPNEQFSTSTNL